MKTIIVATDFSSSAKNAAEYAAAMALSLNANLRLLHVYEIPVVYMEVPIATTEADMAKSSEELMKELKEGLMSKTGNKIKIETGVKIGSFFSELEAVCESIEPYAVVMGSQGTTAAVRLLFGSHTVHAMKHLIWPLITVPQGAKFSAIRKIGLACDFDDVDSTIPVDEIKTLLWDFNAELHVLNTGKQREFNPEIIFGSALLRGKLKGVIIHDHFITNDDVDEGIMEFTEKNQIALLLVIPKRHDLLDKIIHRSHTKNLVLHSHVPVMALHY